MNIIIILLSFLLMLVGFVLVLKNPLLFVIFWSLVGSSSDACGILFFLNEKFRIYSFILNFELIVCTCLSLGKYLNRPIKKYNKYISVSISFIAIVIISFLGVGANGLYIHRIIGILCSYTPLILIIWLTNYDYYLQCRKIKPQRYIEIFMYMQIFLAFLIVYLPEIGIHLLDPISGANYIADGYIYQKDIFYLSDMLTAITSKYNFNGLGQFHNANDMGFYGAVGMFLSVMSIKKEKGGKKPFFIALFIMSLMLWGNSGMRGPIVGIIIGIIAYEVLSHDMSKFVYIPGLLIILVLLSFSEIGAMAISYFIPNMDNRSFVGRSILRTNGLNYIRNHFWLGSGGVLSNLIDMQIDPHELPLRIACLFGVIAAVIIVYIIYFLPFAEVIKAKQRPSFSVIILSVLVMVSITNNYCDIGLFYILFSQSICLLKNGRKGEENCGQNNFLCGERRIANQCSRNSD